MKTAIIHDWLTDSGGAEKVLTGIYKVFPSPLFTLVQKKDFAQKDIFAEGVFTSFIQKCPGAKSRYRSYLPLFPLAIEQFNLSGYDLVLSSSSCAAKGVLTHAGQLHICYCHSPARYVWDLYYDYLAEHKLNRGVKGALAKLFLHYFRMWDYNSAQRVDAFIANSK